MPLHYLHINSRKRCMVECSPWKNKTHRRQCKMSSSKKWTCKKDFAGRCLSVLGLEPHTSSPLHIVHIHVYTYYTYSHRERGEGGTVEPERREEVQQFTIKRDGWLSR